ncbi:MAG: hypothetical protein IPM53_27365 [Anaerolineaceae bacterium]|nr:hypothetical protein [Anaerolineaceae bacterium]
MSRSFRLSLPAANPEKIRFPNRCVCCGAPRQADSTLVVSRLVMRKQRQEPVTLHYAVPHCDRCYRGTKSVFMAGLLPFLTGFILLGGAAFVVVTFYAVDMGLDLNNVPGSGNSLVVGGVAGLAVGLVSAFLFEGVARLLLLPFFGQALWQSPMLMAQFIQDADYVAGLRGKLDPEAKHLLLTFNNNDMAAEFAELNGATAVPDP